jgi:hypothetical protein
MRQAIRILAVLGLLAAAAAAFAGGGWEDSRGIPAGLVVGSGKSATETRDVPSFKAVRLEGSGQVLLTVGSPRSLSVSGDDNLLPLVLTEVDGSTLRLGFKPGTGVRTVTPLVFRVTVPSLSGLAIAGSGDIVGRSPILADRITMEIGGSGNIRAELAASQVTALIQGSGSIEVSGRTESQDIQIHGSGAYRAQGLQSDAASVQVFGSGDTTLSVARELTVSINGSGDVSYRGSPRVSVKNSGSGKVRRL